MRIATWNLNGIRARHGELVKWASAERFDVICLQELKASPEQIPEALTTLPEYWSFWHGRAGGYSGVSLHFLRARFPQRLSFSHPAFDAETRIVQAVMNDCVIASVYVPNGGKDYPAKLAFLTALAGYVDEVHQSGRQLVLCGDMNVAREDRDVYPNDRNSRQICQRPDERTLFEQVIARGLTDVGRALHPNDERFYTWWPYWRNLREKNAGWRLDYVLASAPLANTAISASVQRDVGTSDHAPFVVEFASPGRN